MSSDPCPAPKMIDNDNEYHVGQYIGTIGMNNNSIQVDHMTVKYFWDNQYLNVLVVTSGTYVYERLITSVTLLISGFSNNNIYYRVEISEEAVVQWEHMLMQALEEHWAKTHL